MHHNKVVLTFLAAAISVASGQDLDNADVPPGCRAICQPVIQLENACDNLFDDDNNNGRYNDCVCNRPGAEQTLSACQDCIVNYPDFFMDDDDQNDVDDNEVEQWLRRCGFPVATTNQTSTANITPSPTRRPDATGVFSGSLTTATYTHTETDGETKTRTTIFPFGAWTSGTFTGSYGSLTTSTATYTVTDDDDNDLDTITRTLVYPIGATPTEPGQNTVATTTTGSVSVTTATTTDAQGSTPVVTSPATTFNGSAPIATAAPLLGAGVALLLAGMAL